MRLDRIPWTVFVRQDGPADGDPVTLLHGFPSSSHDWSLVIPALTAAGCRTTVLDFLGFGASAKPAGHRYLLIEQADLVEAVWQRLGIGDTALVSHDYGVSVAQELLARDARRITRTAWLNGGIYPDLHRPIPIQRLLHSRFGPLVARLASERLFTPSLRSILGRPVPDDVLHEMWLAISSDGGTWRQPELLHYIDERREHAHRWIDAVENYPGPRLFVWGPEDPVSGAHVLPRLRALPGATLDVRAGVGHYPQLEEPDEVGAALARFLRKTP